MRLAQAATPGPAWKLCARANHPYTQALLAEVPRLFAGPPIGFIVASLLALAFMGFSGMSTS